MKLSTWAKQQGISYQTAWNWFKSGKLPIPSQKLDTGTILVFPENNLELKTYIYARVSSNNKKDDLDRQVNRCVDFCNSRGYVVEKIIKEIASGMNDNRKKLLDIFTLPPKRIIIEHKDRLTRFGFCYLEKLSSQMGFEIIVINRDFEEQDDLMKDLISIITSFCCRLYGLRRGKNKVKIIKKEIIDENTKNL